MPAFSFLLCFDSSYFDYAKFLEIILLSGSLFIKWKGGFILTGPPDEATLSRADIRGLVSLTEDGLECSELSGWQPDLRLPVSLHLSYLPFVYFYSGRFELVVYIIYFILCYD